jgi:hypothetical protein
MVSLLHPAQRSVLPKGLPEDLLCYDVARRALHELGVLVEVSLRLDKRALT